MSRMSGNRENRNDQRSRQNGSELLYLHFDDDFQALLGDSDDDPQSKADALERLMQNYDSAVLDEPSKWIIFEAVHNAIAEIESGNQVMAQEFGVTLRNWISHRRISLHRPIAERTAPPNRAEMLLQYGLPKRDREYMIGDLEEEYRGVILPKYGSRVAARWYWWQAVRSVVAASGGRVRVWLSFGGLARAAGWIVEKFTL